MRCLHRGAEPRRTIRNYRKAALRLESHPSGEITGDGQRGRNGSGVELEKMYGDGPE